MKRVLVTAAAAVTLMSAQAGIIVNDTWIDGTRNDPASPNYSENGTDADADGDLESAWFHGGSAGTSTTVVNGNPGVTPGILRSTVGTGSSSFTTYFAPEASPVTLASVGDQIRLTWVFTPTGVAGDTGQSFRVAIVDSPASSPARLTVDGNPANGVYPGYAMFMNMNTTLSNANPFQLYERNISVGTSGFLANGGAWTSLYDNETLGVPGYADGTQYTFLFTATLNSLGGLDIYSSMSGGLLGGDGLLEASFTDATPSSLTFDTFGIRPSSAGATASQFDTSLFKVELTQVPEPALATLTGLGFLALFGARRMRR